MTNMRVAIIGLGAVGEDLAQSLHRAGFPIYCLISSRIQAARTLAKDVDAQFVVSYGDELPEGIDLLFLCVPDDAIAQVSQDLSDQSYPWHTVHVAHTSGVLLSAELGSLASLGARVFSFHPVQTFAKGQESEWKSIFIGIEGDESGVQIGQHIADSLGSIPVLLQEEDKVLYHTSAVFASNFFVTIIGIATDILGQINVDRAEAVQLLTPLIQRTCQNIVESGPELALTGPASRGDVQTIKRHAEALGNSLPDKYNIYLELTRLAIELKRRNNPEFEEKATLMVQEIKNMLRE